MSWGPPCLESQSSCSADTEKAGLINSRVPGEPERPAKGGQGQGTVREGFLKEVTPKKNLEGTGRVGKSRRLGISGRKNSWRGARLNAGDEVIIDTKSPLSLLIQLLQHRDDLPAVHTPGGL